MQRTWHWYIHWTSPRGHYSLTLSTFPPHDFDTFPPHECTFSPLDLTLFPPTIWHIYPLFSFFSSGIIFCQSSMSSGGVRNCKLSFTRGLPWAWGWWPSSWRMAHSEVVCCWKMILDFRTQWRKVKQMQPMWLCIFSRRPFEEKVEVEREFEDAFKKTQWIQLKSGIIVKRLAIYAELFNKCIQCDYASSQACDLRTHLKTHNSDSLNKCN